MSIRKAFIPQCDHCGAELVSCRESNEKQAMRAAMVAGWRQVREGAEFKLYCPTDASDESRKTT